MSGKSFKFVMIIVSFVVVFLAGGSINRCCTQQELNDTVSIHDTMIVYLPSPVSEVFVPMERIDTIYVVNDYQVMREYRDTINVTFGRIEIVDTIYNNQLQTQQVICDIDIPPATVTSHKYKITNSAVGIGGMCGEGCKQLSAHYHFDRWTISAGYDFQYKGPALGVAFDIIRW